MRRRYAIIRRVQKAKPGPSYSKRHDVEFADLPVMSGPRKASDNTYPSTYRIEVID